MCAGIGHTCNKKIDCETIIVNSDEGAILGCFGKDYPKTFFVADFSQQKCVTTTDQIEKVHTASGLR